MSESEPRLTPLHRCLAVTGVTTLGGGLALILRWNDVISSPALARLAAAMLGVIGVVLSGRALIHIAPWPTSPDGAAVVIKSYWQHRDASNVDWSDSCRRRMNLCCVADLACALALVAVGTAFFFAEPHYWRELLASLGFGCVVWLVSSVKHELAIKAGLGRGTERARASATVAWVRRKAVQAASFPGLEHADRVLFVRRTPTTELSALILVMLALLGCVALSNAAAIAPEVKQYLERSLHAGRTTGQSRTTDQSKLKTATQPSASTQGSGTAAGGSNGKKKTEGAADATAAGVPPKYGDLCPVTPGEGISDPESVEEMKQRWMSLGQPSAGCAQRAQRVRDTHSVYIVRGFCAGELRALGVVSLDYPAVVLIERAAQFADALIDEGVLRGASARKRIGSGDFHVIYTADGAWVLIRPEITDGNGGLKSTPTRCEQIRPGNEPYVDVPPALADLWLRFGKTHQRTWPARDISRDTETRRAYTFYSDDAARTTVASASCTIAPPQRCELHARDITLRGSGAPKNLVVVDRVLQHGPRR